MPKTLLTFVEDIYEDLELWYPKLRCEEAGYAMRLAAPDGTFLMDAHGAPARLGGEDYLVLALSMSNWDRTQLAVFDRSGGLRYREVVTGTCNAVAAPEPDAFLFGCGLAVHRYTVRR